MSPTDSPSSCCIRMSEPKIQSLIVIHLVAAEHVHFTNHQIFLYNRSFSFTSVCVCVCVLVYTMHMINILSDTVFLFICHGSLATLSLQVKQSNNPVELTVIRSLWV